MSVPYHPISQRPDDKIGYTSNIESHHSAQNICTFLKTTLGVSTRLPSLLILERYVVWKLNSELLCVVMVSRLTLA